MMPRVVQAIATTLVLARVSSRTFLFTRFSSLTNFQAVRAQIRELETAEGRGDDAYHEWSWIHTGL